MNKELLKMGFEVEEKSEEKVVRIDEIIEELEVVGGQLEVCRREVGNRRGKQMLVRAKVLGRKETELKDELGRCHGCKDYAELEKRLEAQEKAEGNVRGRMKRAKEGRVEKDKRMEIYGKD